MELLSYLGSVVAVVDIPPVQPPPIVGGKIDWASMMPMVLIVVGSSLALVVLVLFLYRPKSSDRHGSLQASPSSRSSTRRRRRHGHRPKALPVGQTGGLPPLRAGGNQSPQA